MKARKTVEVAKVKEAANHYNANADTTPEARNAVSGLLEVVLHDTGNYKGFRYTDGTDVVRDGSYDESRRYYY